MGKRSGQIWKKKSAKVEVLIRAVAEQIISNVDRRRTAIASRACPAFRIFQGVEVSKYWLQIQISPHHPTPKATTQQLYLASSYETYLKNTDYTESSNTNVISSPLRRG